MNLQQVLQKSFQDLSSIGADYAVIGGLAVSARTDPRFTRDIDIAVNVQTDREAEKIVHSLIQCGYVLCSSLEQTSVKRLSTVRFVSSCNDDIFVDLLFASSGVEREIVAAATYLKLMEGVEVKVATIEYLIATKVLSRDDDARPQDKADLNTLLKKVNTRQLDGTRKILKLIEERGFNREKDLVSDFEQLL